MGFGFIIRQESHKSASSLLPGLEMLWVSSAWQEMTIALPPAHECQTIVPLLTGIREVPLTCGLQQDQAFAMGLILSQHHHRGENWKKIKNKDQGLSVPLYKPLTPLKPLILKLTLCLCTGWRGSGFLQMGAAVHPAWGK